MAFYVTAAGDLWVAGDSVAFSNDGGVSWRAATVDGYQPRDDVGFAEGPGGLVLHGGGLWAFRGGAWRAIDAGGCEVNDADESWVSGVCAGVSTVGVIGDAGVNWHREWKLPAGPVVALNVVGRRLRVLLGPDPRRDARSRCLSRVAALGTRHSPLAPRALSIR